MARDSGAWELCCLYVKPIKLPPWFSRLSPPPARGLAVGRPSICLVVAQSPPLLFSRRSYLCIFVCRDFTLTQRPGTRLLQDSVTRGSTTNAPTLPYKCTCVVCIYSLYSTRGLTLLWFIPSCSENCLSRFLPFQASCQLRFVANLWPPLVVTEEHVCFERRSPPGFLAS